MFGIALLGPQTPNLGVGLSVVALMVVVSFVVKLVVVVLGGCVGGLYWLVASWVVIGVALLGLGCHWLHRL